MVTKLTRPFPQISSISTSMPPCIRLLLRASPVLPFSCLTRSDPSTSCTASFGSFWVASKSSTLVSSTDGDWWTLSRAFLSGLGPSRPGERPGSARGPLASSIFGTRHVAPSLDPEAVRELHKELILAIYYTKAIWIEHLSMRSIMRYDMCTRVCVCLWVVVIIQCARCSVIHRICADDELR